MIESRDRGGEEERNNSLSSPLRNLSVLCASAVKANLSIITQFSNDALAWERER